MNALPPELQQRAEQISERLNHYYLGVEHLFLAVLEDPNALPSRLLWAAGVSPTQARYVLLDELGQSLDRQYWEGIRMTPRAEIVVALAYYQAGGQTIKAEHVFLGILQERDNFPCRVLASLGIDLDHLMEQATNSSADDILPELAIETDLPLTDADRQSLRHLFGGAGTLALSGEFNQDHHPSRLYHAAWFLPDGDIQHGAVKFNAPEAILHECALYQQMTHQTTTAPHLSIMGAGIDRQERQGALFYALPGAQAPLRSLIDYEREHGLPHTANVLQFSLFDNFHYHWLQTKVRYRFGMWREYEAILPPALVLEYGAVESEHHLYPLEDWSYADGRLQIGETVLCKDFTVQAHLPHRRSVILCASSGSQAVNQASRVLITGLDAARLDGLQVGQSVAEIGGMITTRRDIQLAQRVAEIAPEIDTHWQTPLGALPNPVEYLNTFLGTEIDGYMALVHGNLHPGSLLIDQADRMYPLHWQHMRDSHVLFDWAMLEVSLIQTILLDKQRAEWDAIWHLAELIRAIDHHDEALLQRHADDMERAALLALIRDVVTPLLGTPGDWSEYFATLALMHLASLAWHGQNTQAQRLAVAGAALATDAYVRTRA